MSAARPADGLEAPQPGPCMHFKDQWITPPAEIAAADLVPRAIRGAQAALIRGALLATHASTWADRLAETLPMGARRFLGSAPLPRDWVPVEDVRTLLLAAESRYLPMMQSAVARLIAEQAAGRLEWFQLDEPLATGDSPQDLLDSVPSIYDQYFQGGSGHTDAVEENEAWVSLWVEELWPGWATQEATIWFKQILEGRYAVFAKVSYLPPPPDRPWWHRFHLSWS